LQGATIPAADAGRALLVERIAAIDADGRLAMEVEAAADLIWSSAHAASTLYVMARERQPDPVVITTLRERAVHSICTPDESEKPA
jgi:hypothetical protein